MAKANQVRKPDSVVPNLAQRGKTRDKNAVKVWMITHQIGKRNLNDYQRSVMALKLEDLLKPIAKANQVATQLNGKNKDNKPVFKTSVCQNSDKPIIDTRHEVAKIAKAACQGESG